MRRILRGALNAVELVWWYRPTRDQPPLTFDNRHVASQFLTGFTHDHFNRIALRETWAEARPHTGLSGMTDQLVVELLAREIATGSLRVLPIMDRYAPRFAALERAPSEEAPSPTETAPAPSKEEHTLRFEFLTESGEPIEDPSGFTLIHPDGSEEDGVLAEGKLERDDVEPGTYRMKFKFIESAAWSCVGAHPEEPVDLKVSAKGFKDGTAVKVKIFESFGAGPVAELDAQLKAGGATASWKYRQKVGDPPRGGFIFEAWIGAKYAESGELAIEPHPVEDLKGVQERLKALGYEPGPVDGVMGPKTEAAVRRFQEDYPPLLVDGRPGPDTQGALRRA